MCTYIHELAEWPKFFWDGALLAEPLAALRHHQGRLIGRMESLGFPLQQEAVLATLTQDVVKSSEIEGENLDAAQVRSSVARHLGMDIGGLDRSDREVEGVVEMMLDATRRYDRPLTVERLHHWHASLFPTGRSGMSRITVGNWRDDRDGPMQVISGPIGRPRVHFEAPAAMRLDTEMAAFLEWFNGATGIDGVLKAAVAHLWFVTIHPLDDGNGRIARALCDMALARSENTAQRFYSMSAQIHKERRSYYDLLEKTQRGSLDITPWMGWFLGCLGRAIENAQGTLSAVLEKARFWDAVASEPFNDRQRTMINQLLDGFEGKLTSSKWARITKTSQDTALRDILDLMARGVLERDPHGGRSTSYSLRQF